MDRTVCIEGFPRWVTEANLHALCQSYGRVCSVRIVRDAYGNSMGYGFVQMDTEQDAERIMAELRGLRPFGGPLYVARTYASGGGVRQPIH
jgi:RNA recognition motif-containing protein